MKINNCLEVVVTARPSWARVKSLVYNFAKLNGPESIRVSLVGPSASKLFGDVSTDIPTWLRVERFSTLQESDSLPGIALTVVNGAQALVQKWSIERPMAVLIIADRTETLGVALAASIMQIPLIHLQGGEVSGSIDDKVRDANTKLSDMHLTTNEFTAKRIKEMGEEGKRIFPVGCPSIDLVREVVTSPQSFALRDSAFLGGVGENFDLNSKFGIVMFHPDTINSNENTIWTQSLISATQEIDINWFWFWPNADHGSQNISSSMRRERELGKLDRIHFLINVTPEKFIYLAHQSQVMVGNSSFGIRESAYLGLPVVNIGRRQQGRQRAANVIEILDSGHCNSLVTMIQTQLFHGKYPSSNLYGDGNSGERASKIISDWDFTIKQRIV